MTERLVVDKGRIKRRDRLGIVKAILNLVKTEGDLKKTRIMRGANLSFAQAVEYLELLEDSDTTIEMLFEGQKRSRDHIISDVLKQASKKRNLKTNIMYGANLSSIQNETYLKYLLEKKYLKTEEIGGKTHYIPTPLGLEFAKLWDKEHEVYQRLKKLWSERSNEGLLKKIKLEKDIEIYEITYKGNGFLDLVFGGNGGGGGYMDMLYL